MQENDIDSLYFGAIEMARAGRIDGRASEALLTAARKFAALDLLEDSARFFERLYQILHTSLSNGYKPSLRQAEYFRLIIDEYGGLLLRLERHERLAVVQLVLKELQQAAVP